MSLTKIACVAGGSLRDGGFQAKPKEQVLKSIVLRGYADAAVDLIEAYEAVSSAELFAPVREHLPSRPVQVLDIGAGTGRDAAWFAAQSHDVVAVEPVDALRNAGMARHRCSGLSWIKDTLPELSQTLALGAKFDLIVLSAVWHHLDRDEREAAFPVLRLLASDGGKVVMSLRHGPGAQSRPVYPVRASDTVALATRSGFAKLGETHTPSAQTHNQTSGVTWTWLVFQAA
ncbi:MAG: class I SAM-dependent methyltransferase [Pseudomonadota bacterium]